MADNGLFRTKMFGGFDKKDVFRYFNELSAEMKVKLKKSEKECADLTEKVAGLESQVGEMSEKAGKFDDMCAELEKVTAENEQIIAENTSYSQQVDRIQNENAALTAKCAELESRLNDANAYKDRFEVLSRRLVKTQSDLVTMSTAYEAENAKYNALSDSVAKIRSFNFDSIMQKEALLDDLQEAFYALNEFRDILDSADVDYGTDDDAAEEETAAAAATAEPQTDEAIADSEQ